MNWQSPVIVDTGSFDNLHECRQMPTQQRLDTLEMELPGELDAAKVGGFFQRRHAWINHAVDSIRHDQFWAWQQDGCVRATRIDDERRDRAVACACI